jgi:hypothetical protein
MCSESWTLLWSSPRPWLGLLFWAHIGEVGWGSPETNNCSDICYIVVTRSYFQETARARITQFLLVLTTSQHVDVNMCTELSSTPVEKGRFM